LAGEALSSGDIVVQGSSQYNFVFLAGLLFSVRVMVRGVERRESRGDPTVRTRWAMLAGALTLSGFVGSLLVRLDLSTGRAAAWSFAAAVIGAVSARILVRRAVAMPVSDHDFDPRFELQGVPAIVIQPIPSNGDGLVRLPAGAGEVHESMLRARSIDGTPIAVGVEVGVDRVDDGVAVVEAWSAIEARL